MTESRLVGTVDWYDLRGYGVIRGDDQVEYFVHYSNLSSELTPRKGMRISFLARSRPRNKGGMEAYDVKLVPVSPPPAASFASPKRDPAASRSSPPMPTPSQPSQSNVTPGDSASGTRDAAAEALRLKIARKQGLAPQPVEPFPSGTRVQHALYGAGQVVLAAASTLSVRFDSDPYRVRDLPRAEIQPAARSSTGSGGSVSTPPILRVEPTEPRLATKARQDLGTFVQRLKRDTQQVMTEEGLDSSRIYYCEEPAEPAVAPQRLDLLPVVAMAFEKAEHITTFYSHQAETRKHLLNGHHVVISTPTASGKTESYNPTILESLVNDPNATALYVFPLVALGFDQTDRLRKLNEELPPECRLTIGIYNNNVDEAEKKETLRRKNQILVTTPESLHYIFLPKPYPNWQLFYRKLKYVVLDEAHMYKGVFGSNMANIIRRLLIRCRREGNPAFPQIIISSATVRDPRGLGQQLTGLQAEDFEVVDTSGAPRPRRHFLAIREDVEDLVDLCGDLIEIPTTDSRTRQSRPTRTIVFLRSINEVKTATDNLRTHLRKSGREELVEAVADFYADKADKRDVFIRLRHGEIRCLFTTNALMAGIDIGSLDVAIVKSFPGLVMDARQMFGRAGRAGEGAAIFIASRTDPFDQFYFETPNYLFMGEPENVIVNPENPYLLAAHIQCAAQTSTANYKNREGPLSGEWASVFGETGRDILDFLVGQGQLRISAGSYYLPAGEPHNDRPLDQLRSSDSAEYTLLTESGMKLEAKRRSYAYRDAHLEAIVWHNSRRYRVIEFHDDSRTIICRPEPDDNLRTKGLEAFDLEVIGLQEERQMVPGLASLGFGKVRITTSVSQYLLYHATTVVRCRNRSCRYETTNLEYKKCPMCNGPVRIKQAEKVMDKRLVPHPPDLSIQLTTLATWIEFSQEAIAQFEREFWPRWQYVEEHTADPEICLAPSFQHAVHSVEHALLKAFPERVRCDRDDISGVSLPSPDIAGWRVYLYDNFQEGLGFSREFFDEPQLFLEDGLATIERCSCDDDDGCPVCLKHFRCHQFNSYLSKLAGRYLLHVLLRRPTAPVLEDLADYVHAVVPPDQVVLMPSRADMPTTNRSPRRLQQ